MFNRNQIDSELLLLQSKIAQEKEDFDQELGKVRDFYSGSEFFTKPGLDETVNHRPVQRGM